MTRAILRTLTLAIPVPARAAAQPPTGPRGPIGRPAGMGEELELVARFDTDGDERLDAAERRVARDAIRAGGAGRGGRGGRGGPRGRQPNGRTPHPTEQFRAGVADGEGRLESFVERRRAFLPTR